jgi:uncharacterized protein YkwD
MEPKLSRLVTLAALLVMGGCGGGGDDSSEATPPSQTQASDTVNAPEPEPEPTLPTAGTRATCNLANFESEMLATVNAHRAAGASCGSEGNFPAAPALAWNALLTQASLAHSDDMVSSNVFSHIGSDGSSAGQRATAAGYAWRSLGENIAAGQTSVAGVMAAWMASPGHCANIMRASYKDIGVACVSGGAGNTYRSYWTMSLGLAR